MSVRENPRWKKDGTRPVQLAYSTSFGKAYQSSIESFLDSRTARDLAGRVQLVFTSPPFPLSSPKAYGNETGKRYVEWLCSIVVGLADLLTVDGSLVIEIGNAWVKGSPTMSTAPLEALIAIAESSELHVCQQFICNNPNRLPSPVVYVNRERNRVKDSFTHVWWFSRTPRPYADNRSVLKEYSPAMRKLLDRQSYNPGRRPSDHTIGETSFLRDNGGAIPSNMLEFSGSRVDPNYRKWCADYGIKQHPAKMAEGLAEFFIRFLSRENDVILDPFGGSNTTGAVAESLGRRWTTIERDYDYLFGSIGRFS